jgi:hypothetical protein
MKKLIIILLVSNHCFAESYNLSTNCLIKNEITNVADMLNIPDCGLAKNLVKSPEVQDYYREKVYDKLSLKLATKINQSLEDMVLLDQYYSKNNTDLLPKGNSSVKNNCRSQAFEVASKCAGKITNQDLYNKKLKLLNVNLNKNFVSENPQEALNLGNIINFNMSENLGVNLKEKNACPIKASSGSFILNAQLDNDSAKDFIELINSEPSAIKTDERLKRLIQRYPQFKLAIETKGDLPEKFKNYLKSFNSSSKKSAKEFIDNFFFDDQSNQEKLAETLGDQCIELQKSLKTYLCGPDLEGTQLASRDKDISINLFRLNPSAADEDIFDDAPGDGETFYLAYGFQCLAKEELSKNKNKPIKLDNSVDSWFKDFDKNTRPHSTDVAHSNNKFCAIFNCEEEKLKQSGYCNNGGPVTAKGLESFCADNVKNKGYLCGTVELKYISYLEQFEKNQNIIKIASASENNSSSSQTDGSNTNANSKPHYSAFLENFLGVKGTLAAEGKPITPLTMAEKSKEFVERKLDPTPSQIKIAAPKAAQPPAPLQASISPSQNSIQSEALSQFNQYAQAAPTVKTTKAPAPTAKKSAVTKDSFKFGPENDDDAEVKKMRAEIEALTNSMKGNQSEKLAAITDTNASYSPAIFGGSSKADLARGLNEAEKERNALYQRNLSAWESRLRHWDNDLSDRESRGPSNTSNSAAPKKLDEDNSSSARANNKTDSQIQLAVNTDKENNKDNSNGKSAKANAASGTSGNADAPEASISSTDLASMKIDSLKKLGIDSKSTFIMKIRHHEKFYNVAVKIYTVKGKEILVPLLNESNSSISKIILESPLFSDYKQFQIERKEERNDFAKMGI